MGGELFGLMGISPSVKQGRASYSKASGESVLVTICDGVYARNNVHHSVVIKEAYDEDSGYHVQGRKALVVTHYRLMDRLRLRVMLGPLCLSLSDEGFRVQNMTRIPV